MRYLKDIAHARSGDKGDICNICVFARSPDLYPELKKHIQKEKIKDHFKSIVKGDVTIYEVPSLYGFNIILKQALDGGATRSLRLDTLGKCMASILLRMEV